MLVQFHDPVCMPRTGESPEVRLERALPLLGTLGETYVERRGIPVQLAHEAGVRFDENWDGRKAVVVPMIDAQGHLCSLHGRYLEHCGQQNKMLTIGPGGGVVSVLGGWRSDPLIIVEGLFDALSLAVCGYSSIATVGRWAPWLPEVCVGRSVWLAFDGNRPGEEAAASYKNALIGAATHRLRPPGQSKDWNTALMKQGVASVEGWIGRHFARQVIYA